MLAATESSIPYGRHVFVPLNSSLLISRRSDGALLSELPVSLEQPNTPLLTLILRWYISWQTPQGATGCSAFTRVPPMEEAREWKYQECQICLRA